MAATGQSSVEAVTAKPSGARVTRSVWLISTALSPSQPSKSPQSPRRAFTAPYSLLSQGDTSPPSMWHMSCMP